jgi:hypothetical protein
MIVVGKIRVPGGPDQLGVLGVHAGSPGPAGLVMPVVHLMSVMSVVFLMRLMSAKSVVRLVSRRVSRMPPLTALMEHPCRDRGIDGASMSLSEAG